MGSGGLDHHILDTFTMLLKQLLKINYSINVTECFIRVF